VSNKALPPAASLTTLAGSVPPEAIVKAVELIATIACGGFQLAAERQRFEQDVARLRQNDLGVRERLITLVQLVDHAKITDDARDQIVTTICQLALK
jgi:hypothetical protein